MLLVTLATLITLTNSFGRVEADTLGAQIVSYVPTGEKEVLFRAAHRPDAPQWRHGGIPICWPWFGMHGEPGSIPHGFARTNHWDVVSCENGPEESHASLRLELADRYRLDLHIVLSESLSLQFVMKNLGKESFPVTTGFHPYFSVSHPTNVTIFTEAGRIDCRGGMDGARSVGEGRYLLQDRGCGRSITLFSRGNTKLIVWNVGPEGTTLPGLAADDWKRYVCVEPAVVPRGEGFYLHPQEERVLALSVSVGRMNKESQ